MPYSCININIGTGTGTSTVLTKEKKVSTITFFLWVCTVPVPQPEPVLVLVPYRHKLPLLNWWSEKKHVGTVPLCTIVVSKNAMISFKLEYICVRT